MFKMTDRSQTVKILALSLALFSAGCGKNAASTLAQIVANVTVKTSIVNSDDWVQATATLHTGGFQVAGINLPVTNPVTGIEYGQLSLVPSLCSGTCTNFSAALSIALDITQLSKEPASASILLPNGTSLPVSGLQNATTLEIPVAKTGTLLYFSFGKGVALLGAAIPFSVLDPAGKYVSGVDLFQPIQAGPVNLTAGIFAGAAPKTTGVGLFIDLSSVVNTSGPTPIALETSHSFVDSLNRETQSVITMKAIHPSSSKTNQLMMKLYELSRKGLVLDMKK